jgi:hypothetical protein
LYSKEREIMNRDAGFDMKQGRVRVTLPSAAVQTVVGRSELTLTACQSAGPPLSAAHRRPNREASAAAAARTTARQLPRDKARRVTKAIPSACEAAMSVRSPTKCNYSYKTTLRDQIYVM